MTTLSAIEIKASQPSPRRVSTNFSLKIPINAKSKVEFEVTLVTNGSLVTDWLKKRSFLESSIVVHPVPFLAEERVNGGLNILIGFMFDKDAILYSVLETEIPKSLKALLEDRASPELLIFRGDETALRNLRDGHNLSLSFFKGDMKLNKELQQEFTQIQNLITETEAMVRRDDGVMDANKVQIFDSEQLCIIRGTLKLYRSSMVSSSV